VKKTVSVIAISCLTLLAGCSNQGDDQAEQQPAAQTVPATPPMSTQTQPANHPPMPGHDPSQATPAAEHQAKVVSVTHAAGYSYMEIEANGGTTWLAASPVNAKTGDTIAWAGGATMQNFASKSLRKTFPEIIFVDQVTVVQ